MICASLCNVRDVTECNSFLYDKDTKECQLGIFDSSAAKTGLAIKLYEKQ